MIAMKIMLSFALLFLYTTTFSQIAYNKADGDLPRNNDMHLRSELTGHKFINPENNFFFRPSGINNVSEFMLSRNLVTFPNINGGHSDNFIEGLNAAFSSESYIGNLKVMSYFYYNANGLCGYKGVTTILNKR
jgi:hypothetical protein